MIISDNQVKIDTSQIPESVRDEICRVLLRSVKEYFKDPKHEEEYQRWLVEYEKRKAATAAANKAQQGAEA